MKKIQLIDSSDGAPASATLVALGETRVVRVVASELCRLEHVSASTMTQQSFALLRVSVVPRGNEEGMTIEVNDSLPVDNIVGGVGTLFFDGLGFTLLPQYRPKVQKGDAIELEVKNLTAEPKRFVAGLVCELLDASRCEMLEAAL